MMACRILLMAMLLMAACSSPGEGSQAVCIERMLKEDDSLARIRNAACHSLPLSRVIKEYIRGVMKINTRNCPQDFTRAFEEHLIAWQGMIPVTDNYPHLRGEMHKLFEQLSKTKDSVRFQEQLQKINHTWSVIEKNAAPPSE